MTKNILIIGLFLLVSRLSFSQDTATVTSETKETYMVTNRPGFTEASRAVFKKGFQIETGFQYAKNFIWKGSDEYMENILIPNLGLLYGVSKNVELRVFANYEGEGFKTVYLNHQYYYDLSGLAIGAKINLTDANGAIPEMALLLQQSIPTNNLNAKVWNTRALLAWSYGLPTNFSLSGNIYYGINYDFEDNFSVAHPSYIGYTLNLGYAITSQFGTYAELYGENNLGSGNKFDINLAGGFLYRITPKFQVDLIGGYQIPNGGYLMNAGFSWLILKE